LCDDSILLSATASGFTPLTIKPNITVSLPLGGRTAVILDAEPESFIFTLITNNHRDPGFVRPFPGRHLLLAGDTLSLRSASGSVTLYLWILRQLTCSAASAALTAEHSLSIGAKAKHHPTTVCIFTQAQFKTASMDVRVKSKDQDTTVSFFGIDSAEVPIRMCKLGKRCVVESKAPFFMRIHGNANRSLSIDAKYQVSAPGSGVVYCSILSIPEFAGGLYRQIAQFLGGPSISCRSRAVETLVLIKRMVVVVCVATAIAVVLHVTGIINLFDVICPDEEKRRFENLKLDAYASRIDQAGDEEPI
jgi:hypothetical protein